MGLTNPELNVFAQTNFRNAERKFGIKLDDRRRHMYIIGKTGMGKTTMLENMVLNDIYAGYGLGLVDPHGDFAEKIMDFIPNHRLNDVIYFNPADVDYPIGFNILEAVDFTHRHLVASGLMGVFKKIWPDVWSARMEYILNNTILALLEYPDSTLLGINRMLADSAYRKKVVTVIQDPVVKGFWINEFAKYNERYQQESVAAIQNKIGQFLSAAIIRNIVAQVKSTINIREIMDSRKILIMNLSKGRIGEDSSRLLGGILITKIQLSAMERVDTPEIERQDYFLYVDEFQNFATESFAGILSEARKYRLSLIMAHQYIEQLEETVAAAVFGNVGTIVTFRIGAADAEVLEKEFTPVFLAQDLVNLPKFNVYLKLMIDGITTDPFSATSLPPIAARTGNAMKAIQSSRVRYAEQRHKVEQEIAAWSGMEEAEYVEAPARAFGPPRPEKPKPTDASGNRYPTKCSRCGKETTVPFKPDPSRPTFCEDCYKLAMREKAEGGAGAARAPAPGVSLPGRGAVAVAVVTPSAAPVAASSSVPRVSTTSAPARASASDDEEEKRRRRRKRGRGGGGGSGTESASGSAAAGGSGQKQPAAGGGGGVRIPQGGGGGGGGGQKAAPAGPLGGGATVDLSKYFGNN